MKKKANSRKLSLLVSLIALSLSFGLFQTKGFAEEGLLTKLELKKVTDNETINSIVSDIYSPAKPPEANWIVTKVETDKPVKLSFIVNGSILEKDNSTKNVCFLASLRDNGRFIQIPVPLINNELPLISTIHKITHNSAPDITFSMPVKQSGETHKATFNGASYSFIDQREDINTASPVLAFRNYLQLLDPSNAQNLFAAKIRFKTFCSTDISQENLDKIFEYLTEFVSIAKMKVFEQKGNEYWYSSWNSTLREYSYYCREFLRAISKKYPDLEQAGLTFKCSEYDGSCYMKHDYYSYFDGRSRGPSLKLISAEIGLEKASYGNVDRDELSWDYDEIVNQVIFWANTMEENQNHVRFKEFEKLMHNNACSAFVGEMIVKNYEKDQIKAINLLSVVTTKSKWLKESSNEIHLELEKANWIKDFNSQAMSKIREYCPQYYLFRR